MRLRFTLEGGRVAPQRWEVEHQGHDGGALGVVEAGRGATLTLVVVLGGGQGSRSAVFQSASSVSATKRLRGSTAR